MPEGLNPESLAMNYGIRFFFRGSEYVFDPDLNLPLSPREAVMINLLIIRLAPQHSHQGTVTVNMLPPNEDWIYAFMCHNDLWRHFKKLVLQTRPEGGN